jgi:hypothetical protein
MRRTRTAVAALLLVCLAGCTVKNRLVIDGGGSLADMPEGPVAVLRASAFEQEAPKVEPFIYGVADTGLAASAFAELLAVAARDDAGLEIVHPVDVEKRLRQKEVTFSLEPDADGPLDEARALGCTSYLTVELACWRHRYLLFVSSAQLRCRVSCRSVAGDALIWRADIDAEQRGLSDRELARLALKRMFGWLEQPHAPPDPDPTPLVECE